MRSKKSNFHSVTLVFTRDCGSIQFHSINILHFASEQILCVANSDIVIFLSFAGWLFVVAPFGHTSLLSGCRT